MANNLQPEIIGEKIAGANWRGDIDLLQKMEAEGKLNPLYISELEHWNYLHIANELNPSPVETIRFYLEREIAVNAQDCYGMTPLHYAMRAKNGDAALVLLEAGADPNIPNQDNTVPLAMIGGMRDKTECIGKNAAMWW